MLDKVVPATCSEISAGAEGGVKIYACLLCHPERTNSFQMLTAEEVWRMKVVA